MTNPLRASGSAEDRLDGLRIAIVAGYVGEAGGAARAALLLAERLAGLGAEVSLFVSSLPQTGVAELLDSAGVRLIPPFRRLPQRFWLTRYGVPSWRTVRALAVVSRRTRFDLVLCVGVDPLLRAVLEQNATAGAPVCAWETTEALPISNFVDPEATAYVRRVQTLAVPSATIEANARSTYGYDGAVVRLPFWVDPPEADSAVRHHPPVPHRLLFVGRLCEEKGIFDLVVAFGVLRAARPDVTLAVVGEGFADEVRALAAETEGIHLLGRIANGAMDAVYASADAVVLPSHHEGYPLTPLEACARGLPVVLSRVGSVPELYGGRMCAELTDARDRAGLTDALARILQPDLYQARSADARRLFQEVSAPEAIDGFLRQMVRDTSVERVKRVG
ncbi:MAG TPA: glycosyltransferase family 4 protein [Rubricoccaceae bacterium]|jgi:glycosyltransferase involved in cell wall biosynthesis